jgi:hypothetical protein
VQLPRRIFLPSPIGFYRKLNLPVVHPWTRFNFFMHLSASNFRQFQGCHPDHCHVSFRSQRRFDDSAPIALKSVSHWLSSIPNRNRITSFEDLPSYFANWTGPDILFTYNPSIIALPENGLVAKNAIYLASFRISSMHRQLWLSNL